MMRLIYCHPRTHIPVSGVRLGPGATVTAEDVYDCSDGKWRSGGNFVHTVIREGCETVWIRTTGLSDTGRDLLEQLIIHPHYLTKVGSLGWRRIPTPSAKADDRVHWPVYQDAADELRLAGFITPMSGDLSDLFHVTDIGKRLLFDK